MQPLRHNASLTDLQNYVAKMEAERGLDGLSLDSQCLKLGEEIGELITAATAAPLDPENVGTELVDCLILNASIANRAGVRLDDALCTDLPTLHGASLAQLKTHVATTELAELTAAELCLRTAQQAGELYRAVRKLNGDPTDPHGRIVVLADSCVAIVILASAIARGLDLDLEDAWRAKEELNNRRTWQ